MKLKLITGIVLTLFLMGMLALSSEAQVGIKAGDWIKYDYKFTGVPPGTLLTTWEKVEFLSVEGTNATVRLTVHMSDGTEQSQTMTVDIVASAFAIPANCTTGDSIYINGNVTIAGETTRTYAGARRTVVYASFSQYEAHVTYYWDKQTGVNVELSVISGGMTVTVKATETNMWQAAPLWMQWWFWVIAVWAIAGTVVLAGIIHFLKKKKPPTPTAPTPPKEDTLKNTHRF